ncbi:hypothetical protein [Paracidovorax wautersii]|uniref:hypothetical protein n=1 Tax=Paracidovorax wautersii TaxID=1177982 RepID=UPI0031E40745
MTTTTRLHTDRAAATRASAALQAQTKAANTAAPAAATAAATRPSAHLRQLAQEKHTSAQHLLRQYEQRCSANPHTRFTKPVVALWEGYFALTKLAENYARMADEADATVHAGQLQSTATATTSHPAAAHAA